MKNSIKKISVILAITAKGLDTCPVDDVSSNAAIEQGFKVAMETKLPSFLYEFGCTVVDSDSPDYLKEFSLEMSIKDEGIMKIAENLGADNMTDFNIERSLISRMASFIEIDQCVGFDIEVASS